MERERGEGVGAAYRNVWEDRCRKSKRWIYFHSLWQFKLSIYTTSISGLSYIIYQTYTCYPMFYLNMSLPFSSSDWEAKWLTNFVFYHIYDEIIFMRDVRIASARKYFFASTLLSRFSSSFTWSLSLVRLSLVSLSHGIKTKKHNIILVKKLQSSLNGQHLVIQEKKERSLPFNRAHIFI